MSQTEIELDVAETLIDEETLRDRVAELGAEISADYAGRDLMLIGVLKGAVFFMADLMRSIDVHCEVDFMAISSYGASTDSSGVVRILKDLDANIEVCALLTKPDRREIDVPVRYIGFEIPNRFVVGYGLDFAERYRNLRYVGVLSDEAAADV